MASSNVMFSVDSQRSDDDFHDHIGSQSATPAGAQTPRPDLQDKRLPGIMHQYFGQVRTESSNSVSATQNTTMSSLEEPIDEVSLVRQVQGLSVSKPLTAPSTPSEDLDSDQATPSAEQFGFLSEAVQESLGCLTPPVSSSSSLKQKELDESERSDDTVTRRVSGDKPRSSQSRGDSPNKGTRLHQKSLSYHAGRESLPGIVTDVSVEATHFSPIKNNTRSSSSATSPTFNHSPVSALSSCLDLVKLTRGVALPRKKNTPPHTPRANSSPTHDVIPPPSSSSSSRPRLSTSSNNQNGTAQHDDAKNTDSYIELPPTRKPKGKLLLHISHARGLKPSFDPYVVCFFELNEYITRGPKPTEQEVERSQSRPREAIFGGVPIQRSGSDMGRPIAIPMKSRQGSSTSVSDHRNGAQRGQQVTAPHWDIEATFDVLADNPEVFLYVYDRANQEAFLGLAKMTPDVGRDNNEFEGWVKLEPRNEQDESVSGEIHIRTVFHKKVKTKTEPSDFEILKLIGKGKLSLGLTYVSD